MWPLDGSVAMVKNKKILTGEKIPAEIKIKGTSAEIIEIGLNVYEK